MSMTEPLLELVDVHAGYGALKILQGVNMTCRAGQIVTVLGPNGAGKSTVLKAAFGLVPVTDGVVKWCGEAVKPEPAFMIQNGLSFVPQGRSVFPTLSVRENLETAVHFLKDPRDIKQRLAEMVDLFPALKDKWNAPAGKLSGGQQQMVVLARGLMTRPKLLLLDEPSLGLSPKLVGEVFAKIKDINAQTGTGFIIVEHNLKSLLGIIDHVTVLTQGRVVAEGVPTAPVIQNTIHTVFRL